MAKEKPGRSNYGVLHRGVSGEFSLGGGKARCCWALIGRDIGETLVPVFLEGPIGYPAAHLISGE